MKKGVIVLVSMMLLFGCATAERDAARVPDQAARGGEFYSFLILPCFQPPQEYLVMVREDRYVIGKQGYDCAGGYPHHRNSCYEEVEITSEEWHVIRDPLLAAGFWDDSVADCQDFAVLDGDSLRISGAKGRMRKDIFLRDAYCRKDLSQFTAIATKAWQTFEAQKENRSANQIGGDSWRVSLRDTRGGGPL